MTLKATLISCSGLERGLCCIKRRSYLVHELKYFRFQNNVGRGADQRERTQRNETDLKAFKPHAVVSGFVD